MGWSCVLVRKKEVDGVGRGLLRWGDSESTVRRGDNVLYLTGSPPWPPRGHSKHPERHPMA